MKTLSIWAAGAVAPLLLLGCSTSGQAGISSESADASARVLTSPDGGRSSTLGVVRVDPKTCESVDLTPETHLLSEKDVRKLLDAKGITYQVSIEREDLHLFDVELHGKTARLRVATLDTPREAGRHLHQALLEHGMGYWGVHRGNIAVLGPEASVDDAIGFSIETGLACWGVLTAADRDDTFMIAGGYFEL